MKLAVLSRAFFALGGNTLAAPPKASWFKPFLVLVFEIIEL